MFIEIGFVIVRQCRSHQVEDFLFSPVVVSVIEVTEFSSEVTQ